MKKLLLVLAFTITLSFCVGFDGCKSSNSNSNSGDKQSVTQKLLPPLKTTLKWANRAVPIFKTNNWPTSKLEKFIKIGNDLVPAFENTSPDALDQIAGFVKAFDEIIADVDLIKDAKIRTGIMIALGFVDDALHDLADKAKVQLAVVTTKAPRTARAQASQGDSEMTLLNFAKRPRWQCRNRATGRFEKKEKCQAKPESVEVIRPKE